MKKRKTAGMALLCALLLLFSLLPSAAGAQSMYFMAVNDKFLDYKAENMPFLSGGTIYVPYKVFIEEHNGGVNFWVFYGVGEKYNTLSLYSRSDPVLTFDIGAGYAYDASGNTYTFRAIVRNGVTFVPAAAVCNYFGLEYSYLPNDSGVLIRIKKDGSYWLNDRVFVSSAAESNKFIRQREQFDRDQAAAQPATPSLSPSPSPSASQPVDKSRVQVSFAFRCDGPNGPERLLDALEGKNIHALFFFRPADLPQWDDQIRRLLGEGHRIGLIVDGSDLDTCLLQLQQGNQLLSHIARTKTDFLLSDGPDGLYDELREAGWVCWKGNISGLPTQDIRPASLSANILLNVEAKRSYARILMNDSDTCITALIRLLPQLSSGGYSMHTITETDLT